MAQKIVMPKLGNTVESVVIVEWRKNPGDSVEAGEVVCEVETDKATVEVESESAGTLLAQLGDVDDEIAVLAPYMILGEAGEDVSAMLGDDTPAPQEIPASQSIAETPLPVATPQPKGPAHESGDSVGSSPRARQLASRAGLEKLPAQGSGPGGRVIERDVQAVLDDQPVLTPAAQSQGGRAPEQGTGIGERVRAVDMDSLAQQVPTPPLYSQDFPGPVDVLPVKGIRKVIAQRMHDSLASTAQLTLHASASADALLQWREGYKSSPEDLGLSKISLNAMVMFAVTRVLLRHPELNATYHGQEIRQYHQVHLGFAVDTPKGLMVPVIKNANSLSLTQISGEIRRLAAACREGKASPDDLSGGTFTISNLGAFGIERFTPVLNAPEVAILGVGSLTNAPVERDGALALEKRMGLSLTVDHQAVDGAPGARFLSELSSFLTHPEWMVAL
ncbi:MAG: 2-oxo acid dehydrogenase subunit E2 [Spirochaetales bacterium]|nr:2-oxo acid dehydrogenase subunit E2 [Spirochaetales bacterium]